MRRIAIVSTPRSGNTWLRGLIRFLIDGDEVAEHRPGDFAWSSLPEDVVLQLHWRPTPEFRGLLQEHGFSVITIVRHPLDVLISILHFCRHEPATAQWLDGEGGSEALLVGRDPLSAELLEYATSDRFRRLLGVSTSWVPLAAGWLRYEDLVSEPEKSLQALASSVDIDADGERVHAALASKTLDIMKPTAGNQHYWQGQPGLWRTLLPADRVEQIRPAVATFAEAFSYDLEPDPQTTEASSRERWQKIVVPGAGGSS